ncbi:hypothetical protein [Microvirus D_HF4_274]|nr:hypothetical protein [Microvirus D_HF4_274]
MELPFDDQQFQRLVRDLNNQNYGLMLRFAHMHKMITDLLGKNVDQLYSDLEKMEKDFIKQKIQANGEESL